MCYPPLWVESYGLYGVVSSSSDEMQGELSYAEVAQEMKLSSALIMFSRYENQPCVIVEALCCGLPVISSSVGGIPEIINDANGMLVSSENENELIHAMKQMIQNYRQYNRKQMADDAAKKFSYGAVGKEITAVYKGIMKG